MTTLILRLKAPLQSWGISSDYITRDTAFTPTKSGVIGLLACAIGIERGEPLDYLNALKMTTRVDNPGVLIEDFQTAEIHAQDIIDSKKKAGQRLYKHYLADANFVVFLEGDKSIIEMCAKALQSPVWSVFLGRKNCIPSVPVFQGISTQSPSELVESWEFPDKPCQVIEETDKPGWGSERRNDVLIPYKNGTRRKWGTRFIKTRIVGIPQNKEQTDYLSIL